MLDGLQMVAVSLMESSNVLAYTCLVALKYEFSSDGTNPIM
jgi:hypothetical protein